MLFLRFLFQMCHALTFLLLTPTLFLHSLTLLLSLPLQLFLSLTQLLLSLTQTHFVRRRHTYKCRALLSTQTHVQIETFARQPPSKCPHNSVLKSVILQCAPGKRRLVCSVKKVRFRVLLCYAGKRVSFQCRQGNCGTDTHSHTRSDPTLRAQRLPWLAKPSK